MPENLTIDIATVWSESLTAWNETWPPVFQKLLAPLEPGVDPFARVRQTTDQILGGWTTYLERVLHTPTATRLGGKLLDEQLNVEKPLREQTTAAMQKWLEFINMPSRQDLVRLASQLNDANARLDTLTELVETLQDRLDEQAEQGDRIAVVAGGAA